MKHIPPLPLIVMSMIILVTFSACGKIEATNDSRHIADAAAKIADFDLPADFVPQFSAGMSGYTVAAYKGPNGPSHLFLIQSEKEADGPELEKMLKELAPGASDPNTRMTVIENRKVTVRGQEADMVISEGTNSENVTYRQATVGFAGKGGPALLVFSETVANWNQDAVDAFLQSVQ
jgi:hypothetical protein